MVALLRHVDFSPCVARLRMSIVRVVATVETAAKLPVFERFTAYRRFGGGLAFTP